MNYTTIQFEIQEGIARIKLNRPEVLNAWNLKMSEEVNDAIQRVNADKNVRVLILSGNGRTFCSGHDLKEAFQKPDEQGFPSELMSFIDYERKKIVNPKENLRTVKVPTIAQVQGHAIAGGFVLMNMCDLVIAAEGTQMGLYGVKFGPPPDENIPYLWMMPIRMLKEMVFTGRLYDAEEFYRIGLINKVVSLEKLEEEVMALAKEIMSINPVVNRLTKENIHHCLDIMGYSNTQLSSALYHWIGHQVIGTRGGFEAYGELGPKWFIQKTKEGAFKDFEATDKTNREAMKELKRKKGKKG
jgi:enoyl-CoA hydratase/carnithine racemase